MRDTTADHEADSESESNERDVQIRWFKGTIPTEDRLTEIQEDGSLSSLSTNLNYAVYISDSDSDGTVTRDENNHYIDFNDLASYGSATPDLPSTIPRNSVLGEYNHEKGGYIDRTITDGDKLSLIQPHLYSGPGP
jgi:hypothetical protein